MSPRPESLWLTDSALRFVAFAVLSARPISHPRLHVMYWVERLEVLARNALLSSSSDRSIQTPDFRSPSVGSTLNMILSIFNAVRSYADFHSGGDTITAVQQHYDTTGSNRIHCSRAKSQPSLPEWSAGSDTEPDDTMLNNALQGLANTMPAEAQTFTPTAEPLERSRLPEGAQYDCLSNGLDGVQTIYMPQFSGNYPSVFNSQPAVFNPAEPHATSQFQPNFFQHTLSSVQPSIVPFYNSDGQ